jgi:3-methyladenine DNA glycosylase/8-oxoguanine DNA glycosylase
MHFRAVILVFCNDLKLESSRELEQRAEAWRPWRAYAAMCLWNMASENRSCASQVVRPGPQRGQL